MNKKVIPLKKTKRSRDKKYPIIKPTKLRTKNSPQSITNFIDPSGGHGESSHPFDITIRATPKNWERLKDYVMNDPVGFALNIEQKFLWYTPDFEKETYHGLHSKTHGLEHAIKRCSTKIFVIAKYWISKPENKWPNKFATLMKKLREYHDGDLEYFIDPDLNKDICHNIAHAAIVASQLGKLAEEHRLKLYSYEEEILYLKSHFYKTYISKTFTEQLDSMFNDQEDLIKRNEMYVHYTNIWLEELSRSKNDWAKLLKLKAL